MAHWRDSARIPQFYGIDGRAAFPMLLFLLHIEWWTFICASIATAFFAVLAHYSFTINVFCRWFKSWLAGPRKICLNT